MKNSEKYVMININASLSMAIKRDAYVMRERKELVFNTVLNRLTAIRRFA